jgi:hypothetical protein
MTLHVGTNGIPGLPTESSPNTQRRCPGCRGWYLKSLGDCPDCAAPAARFNKWLRHAQLDRQLYSQAGSAEKEKAYAKAHGL